MRRMLLAPLAVMFLLLLAPEVALGCVCFGTPEKRTPEQVRAMLVRDFNEAVAVFSGEVVAIDTFKVKLKVDKLWKGDFGDEAVMSTGTKDNGDGIHISSSCDYSFKLGEKYLVYAYGASPEDMQARECTRTRPLNYAEQEMKDLDEVWPHVKKNQEPEDAGGGEPRPPVAEAAGRRSPCRARRA